MKKAIAGALVVLLAACGAYLYGQYREAARTAEFDEPPRLSREQIRAGLSSDDPRDRLAALEQIEGLDPAERRRALLDALGSRHPATRLTAVSTLSRMTPYRPAEVETLLSVAREDPDADVRQAAFDALTGSGDARVLDLALSSLLESESLPVRLAAARALDELTGRSGSQELAAAIEEAEATADRLGMDWESWLEERRSRLVFDRETGRFE